MRKTLLLLAVLMLITAQIFGAGASALGDADGSYTLPSGRVSYPINTDAVLSIWTGVNSNVAPYFTNYSEVPFYRGWSERTGIRVNYVHPPAGAENEQFNIIVASGDLPDIFWRNFLTHPGGPERAIDEGIIIAKNDLIARYAPYLSDILRNNPDWDRLVKTDVGTYYTFPNIREDVFLSIWQGPIIRSDFLTQLGLAPPVTFDDWYAMLSAFRDRLNIQAPLSMPYNNPMLMYGYGFEMGWFIDANNRVSWGRSQPAYRDYLEMMARWYREGLLDPDIATITAAQRATKMSNGTAGATEGALSSGMGVWLPAGRTITPNYSLMGVSNPVRNRGDRLTMINLDNPFSGANGSVSISGRSRHPDVAARFLDWAYGPEGHRYSNFGTEGVSYTLVNGQPILTDLILRNPAGLSIGHAAAQHVNANYGGPHIQSASIMRQLFAHPEQVAAIEAWTIDDPFRHKLPPLTPTPEESTEMAQIIQAINTYANEMMVRFILGLDPVNASTFDAYIDQIRRMGLDRAAEIQNAAYRRFLAR